MDDDIEQKVYKIILYGDNYAGTTSLLRQFIYHSFDQNFYTYQNYFLKKTMTLDNEKQVIIQFWDIHHYHRYERLKNLFFKNADGFMLTYDISSRRTFERLGELLDQIIEYTKEGISRYIYCFSCL